MFSTGGDYELSSTIGQPDAGLLTAGDESYVLRTGFWVPSWCKEDSRCDDGDDCTVDTCAQGNPEAEGDGCVHEYRVVLFADIAPGFCPPTCPQPDVDDIMCLLDDFRDGPAVDGCESSVYSTDLAPCGGDGLLDLDDILAVLDAFAQVYACPHPCP